MYTKKVPYKNFKGQPRTAEVQFNLTEREVFKLLPELMTVAAWRELNTKSPARDLPTEEVREYYNNFEAILLEAWGVMSEDGEHFRKGGRYEFEESALFNAAMVMFVSDPIETGALLDGIMPNAELSEMVKKADVNMLTASQNENLTPEQRERVAELQRQLAEAQRGIPEITS